MNVFKCKQYKCLNITWLKPIAVFCTPQKRLGEGVLLECKKHEDSKVTVWNKAVNWWAILTGQWKEKQRNQKINRLAPCAATSSIWVLLYKVCKSLTPDQNLDIHLKNVYKRSMTKAFLAILFLWVTEVHFCSVTQNQLKPTVSWTHWASPGSGRIPIKIVRIHTSAFPACG